MYSFDYERPSGVNEAVSAVGEDDKFLAGGQTLLPTLKLRLAQADKLIDLGGIAELKGISVSGSELSIGAMTRHVDVANSADVKSAIPALSHLASHIGDAQVRNRGTIGGSIANNDPAADYPAALVGLGATVHTDKRSISAEDFFIDLFETALEEDELVTKVTFPIPEKAGYAKFPNPASRFALTGVFVAQTAQGVRVAVTGAGPCVFRQTDMEAALSSNFSAEAVSGIKTEASGLSADIHASADYRANLISVMAARAVQAAS
ncbi:xanthine dehydrogenase family protein subunit M [Sneathiella sp.]|uniref:FAD binding domain-containing protein n=1 Tax=Sneathiella sp. TaxID=1964365 RepID=UPI002634153F|nr:xanthine dehydrogenase family protein subunit M [Sneathiella sp.]MDF2368396.1 xanthine dehydrogenase family protein subunit M [Sneathiella sp.]